MVHRLLFSCCQDANLLNLLCCCSLLWPNAFPCCHLAMPCGCSQLTFTLHSATLRCNGAVC